MKYTSVYMVRSMGGGCSKNKSQPRSGMLYIPMPGSMINKKVKVTIEEAEDENYSQT